VALPALPSLVGECAAQILYRIDESLVRSQELVAHGLDPGEHLLVINHVAVIIGAGVYQQQAHPLSVRTLRHGDVLVEHGQRGFERGGAATFALVIGDQGLQLGRYQLRDLKPVIHFIARLLQTLVIVGEGLIRALSAATRCTWRTIRWPTTRRARRPIRWPTSSESRGAASAKGSDEQGDNTDCRHCCQPRLSFENIIEFHNIISY
jgi:hypothetical protein